MRDKVQSQETEQIAGGTSSLKSWEAELLCAGGKIRLGVKTERIEEEYR